MNAQSTTKRRTVTVAGDGTGKVPCSRARMCRSPMCRGKTHRSALMRACLKAPVDRMRPLKKNTLMRNDILNCRPPPM
eukprot:15459897-Alexandrium_andersonii.AAC.1